MSPPEISSSPNIYVCLWKKKDIAKGAMSPSEILAVLRLVGRATITYLLTHTLEKERKTITTQMFGRVSITYLRTRWRKKNYHSTNVWQFYIAEALNVDVGWQDPA